MQRKPIATLFVVTLLGSMSVAQSPPAAKSSEFATSIPSPGAADMAGWDRVKQSVQYSESKVVLTSGETYQGMLIAVNDQRLVIHSETGDQMIERTRIQRVSIRREGHYRRRNVLIGLTIGAGVGLGVGLKSGSQLPKNDAWDSTAQEVGIGIPVCAAIGAGIGALLPAHGKWHEVYRSK